jgi:hypothetical protein
MKNKNWEFGYNNIELLTVLKNEHMLLQAKEKGARMAFNLFLKRMVADIFFDEKIYRNSLIEVNFNDGAKRFIFEEISTSWDGGLSIECYPILKSGRKGKCLESLNLLTYEQIKSGALPRYVYLVGKESK